jgi:hypothetical protein
MARSRPRVRLTRLTIFKVFSANFDTKWIAKSASSLATAVVMTLSVAGCGQSVPHKQSTAIQSNANSSQLVAQTTSLEAVIDRAEASLKRFRSDVQDYTGTLTKRERIGKSLGEPQSMAIKVRSRKYAPTLGENSDSNASPKVVEGLHAYLRFTKPSSVAGREVIWIEGKNDNQLTVHEAGMLNLMSMHLDPNGTIAMVGSKYPITEIGIEKLLEKLIERGMKDKLSEPTEVTITPGSMLGDVACDRIRIVHPKKQDSFDFHIAEVWIDPRHEIPLYYASYDWPKKAGESPELLEEYGYSDLQLNVGLSDTDFDPKNKDYQFP